VSVEQDWTARNLTYLTDHAAALAPTASQPHSTRSNN